MRNQYRFLFVVAALLIASLGCGLPSGLLGSSSLFEDDFSESGHWGTSTDANSSIEYTDGGLRMRAFTNNYFIWSTPDADRYENVHVEVTAKNNATPATTAFGILCNQQAVNDLFYYLVMTPAGEYAIAETSLTQNDVFLTNNDKWAQSDSIAVDAPSYRLGADCRNGSVTFYVDGQQVASVTDDSFTAGTVGLLLWSGEEANTADVTFDDFVVTKLQ